MPLSATTLVVVAAALAAIVAGSVIAWRQRRRAPDDPRRYAFAIAGVMLAAFGLMMGSFFAALDLMRP